MNLMIFIIKTEQNQNGKDEYQADFVKGFKQEGAVQNAPVGGWCLPSSTPASNSQIRSRRYLWEYEGMQ